MAKRHMAKSKQSYVVIRPFMMAGKARQVGDKITEDDIKANGGSPSTLAWHGQIAKATERATAAAKIQHRDPKISNASDAKDLLGE